MDVFRYVTRCGKIFENKKDTAKAIDNPLNITFIFQCQAPLPVELCRC